MIDVEVRSASGSVLSKGRGAVVGTFFQADSGRYPTLVHIVPWGDTVFNRSQVSVLETELHRYQVDPKANPKADSLDWLLELIQLVKAEPHRMLWFVGD